MAVIEILVEIAELTAAANNMNSAKETYEGAIEDVHSAADDLASKWEGDGQVAFVADQAQAYTYYRSLVDIAMNIIQETRKVAERYRDHFTQLANKMK